MLEPRIMTVPKDEILVAFGTMNDDSQVGGK